MPRLLVPLKLFPVPKKQLCKKIPRSFLEKAAAQPGIAAWFRLWYLDWAFHPDTRRGLEYRYPTFFSHLLQERMNCPLCEKHRSWKGL